MVFVAGACVPYSFLMDEMLMNNDDEGIKPAHTKDGCAGNGYWLAFISAWRCTTSMAQHSSLKFSTVWRYTFF